MSSNYTCYTHVYKNRNVLFIANANNRLGCIICGMKPSAYKNLTEYVTKRIRELLLLQGYTETEVAEYISKAGEPVLTKTHGKKAAGNHKLSAIASVLNAKQTSIIKYLTVLADLDVVERQVPIMEENPEKSKKGLYFILFSKSGFDKELKGQNTEQKLLTLYLRSLLKNMEEREFYEKEAICSNWKYCNLTYKVVQLRK